MSLRSRFLRKFDGLVWRVGLAELHDMVMEARYMELLAESPNPLLSPYVPGFSQVDEDSILERILNRLGLGGMRTDEPRFVELGVGDGSQNNTIALILKGWSGLWFGGEPLRMTTTSRVKFQRLWITRESLKSSVLPAVAELPDLRVVSLDLDGNDWWLCSDLLEGGVRPDVWIQEYNPLLGPTIEWIMPYDPRHVCKYDGYHGASLQAFVSLFGKHGYSLVACSASGANAFFVRSDHSAAFADVPSSAEELFMPERSWLYKSRRPLSPLMLEGVRPGRAASGS